MYVGIHMRIYVKMSHFLTDGFLSVYFIDAVLSLCLRKDFFIELLCFYCKLQENIVFLIALINQTLEHTHSFSIINIFHILDNSKVIESMKKHKKEKYGNYFVTK